MKNYQICSCSAFKKLIFIFFISVVLSTGTIHSQCVKLLWADEFDANSLDLSKWKYDIGDGCPLLCKWGNNELQYYKSENVVVANGKLAITAKEEAFEASAYTSGKIITKGLKGWVYGRFEASIKMPAGGKGIWPAFWLLSSENKYGNWPNSGEIDIVEMLGHEPNKIYGSVHFGPPYNHFSEPFVLPTGNFSDDFHVFAVEWGPDSIKWFVDDSLYSVKTKADVNPWAPFDEEFYIIFNLAVGGNWPGNPDNTTVFPQTLEVDYVRVYGEPAVQKIQTKGAVVKNAMDVNFSVAEIPSAKYNWTIPNDVTLLSGQGTSSILVNLGCSEGNIDVEIETDCDTVIISNPVKFQAIEIKGNNTVFPLDTMLLYSLPQMHNTTYLWELPENVVINQGNTSSNQLKLNWGCNEGNISVGIANNCETQNLELNVAFKAIDLFGFESVQENMAGAVYTVTSVPFAQSYIWALPEGAVVTKGEGTNQITVTFGNTPGDVSVTYSTLCGSNALSLPVFMGSDLIYCSFEASTLEFLTFADTEFERVANPFKTSSNLSAHVGKTYKSATAWAGIYADLNAAIDFSVNNTFKFKVYGPKQALVKLKLEADGSFVEKDANYTSINEWQELTYDFTGTESGLYTRLTLFFDFGSTETNHFYFDDIIFTYESVQNLIHSPLYKNEYVVFPNPVSEKLHISSINNNIADVKILDLAGRVVLQSKFNNSNVVDFSISGVKPGAYLVVINGKTAKNIFVK